MKKRPDHHPEKAGYSGLKTTPFIDLSMVTQRSDWKFENLLPVDLEVLGGCDLEADHLLQYDESRGEMNAHSIRIISEKGLLQRLLTQGFIHVSAKLTAKGDEPCKDLRSRSSAPSLSSSSDEGHPGIQHEEGDAVNHPSQPDESAEHSNLIRSTGIETGRHSKVIPYRDSLSAEDPATSTGRQDHSTCTVEDSLIAYLAEQSLEAEQIKMLKTCILFPVNGKPPSSILITSVEPGDGKSFVAANLAVSIAKNMNTHVLLMDCDLRKPTLHSIFGLRNRPGLAEYLSEGRRLPLLLQKTVAKRLTVLTAGSPPKNPAELLSSPRMTSLVKETAKRYPNRIVILDSPPSTMTAEAAVLARLVDGILMVARHGKTRLKDLQQVITKLGKDKFLGCVINGYQHSLREYYGYRKYPGYTGTPETEILSAKAVKSGSVPGK